MTERRQQVLNEIADRQGAEYAATFIDGYVGTDADVFGALMAAESKLTSDRLARAEVADRQWQTTKDQDRATAAATIGSIEAIVGKTPKVRTVTHEQRMAAADAVRTLDVEKTTKLRADYGITEDGQLLDDWSPG